MVKEEGGENDLLDRLVKDPAIGMDRAEIDKILDLKAFVGRAPDQVTEFLATTVAPILERNSDRIGLDSDVRV